jgi:hypothetical protein
MAVASGVTKMDGADMVRLFSGQQAIGQLLMPLAPWCSQSNGVFSAPVCCGRAGSGFECLCAMHIPPLQQSIPSACQAVAHNGAHNKITANRHTHAPTFPGAIGMTRDLFIVGVGRIPQLASIHKIRQRPLSQAD